MVKKITRKKSKPLRQFAHSLIRNLHKDMKEKYRFDARLVGSAKYNTIMTDKDGFWDIDYQILLTKKSKVYKNNFLTNPSIIKNDFFNYFNNKFKNNKTYRIENSTTAITLINTKEKYSIDFVIIRIYPDNNEIIRRNNKSNSSVNEFTWNKLPQHNEAYKLFNELSYNEKRDVIENYILPRKYIEKQKDSNDVTKKSSCEIFIEEVMNYANRKRNN